MPTNPLDLIGSAEAARLLGVHRATFNRWVDAGRVPIAVEFEGLRGPRLFDAGVIAGLVAAQHIPAGGAA